MRWIVSSKDVGITLQNFLKTHLEECSGKAAKALIDRFGCKVNGKVEVFSSYKVRQGDLIEVHKERVDKKAPASLDLLHETEHYLVCLKGAYTPTEPELFKKLLKRKDIYLVHRLDKETSGVILIAKNLEAKKTLENLFKERKIDKIYHALSEGQLKNPKFKVENFLGKISSYQGQAIWGQVSKEAGAFASTSFKLLKSKKNLHLIECSPLTGRTHQIRVHLFEKGAPIVGDMHYEKKKRFSVAAPRVMLHAFEISFIDPFTHQKVSYMAPYPKDFLEILDEHF